MHVSVSRPDLGINNAQQNHERARARARKSAFSLIRIQWLRKDTRARARTHIPSMNQEETVQATRNSTQVT